MCAMGFSSLVRTSGGRTRRAVAIVAIVLGLVWRSSGVPFGVEGPSQLWSETVREAAESVLKIIKVKTEMDLSLRHIPPESFQLFVGKQHLLGVEVEGVQYNIVQDLPHGDQEMLSSTKLHQLPASGLVPREWHQLQEHSLSLPEATLSGPLELWLPKPMAVNLFTPLATDVGSVGCVVLAEGVTVRVQGMKGVALRRPITLPHLPAQYLAEVMAHARLGVPEPGFENAPGILYMASELKRAALNSTVGRPLLSLEVEPASSVGLSIASVWPGPADVLPGLPPRLKVRKLKGASVELSVRPGQVAPAKAQPDSLRAQIAQLQALEKPSAWPLPYMDMSLWVPYETVLRNVLTSHPFDVDKIQRRGIEMKLVKSVISGVNLLSFEMEVHGELPATSAKANIEAGFAEDEGMVQVWEAVVKVDSVNSKTTGVETSAPGSGLSFTPLRVQLKEQHENTVTLSRRAMHVMIHGDGANFTTPLGFEEAELGIAHSA